MMCSCSAATPPKCVCEDNDQLPPPLPPPELMSRPPKKTCSDQCHPLCVDSCQSLLTALRCNEVCPDACNFSCLKQEIMKTNGRKMQNKSEYKFIIPKTATSRLSLEVAMTRVPEVPYNYPIPTLAPYYGTPTQKTCEAECMPDCSTSCITLRPALKLLNRLIESKSTSPAECLKTCTQTCEHVCMAAGMDRRECQSLCGETCEETCRPAGRECVTPCMPSCHQECIERSNRLVTSATPTIVFSTTSAIETLVIFPKSATVQSQCEHECKVQCARQCALHQLSGAQCEAACRTTCVPVCQSKLRRRHSRPLRRRIGV